MEIIAICSVKGGVGKTTTAVNLSYLSSQAGWPTLLWDLDPQGAATYMLRSKTRKKASVKKLIGGSIAIDHAVRPSDYDDLDILPADFSYRSMDLHLHHRKKPAAHLAKLMEPLHRRYGCLFLDCPPGLSLVSENVLCLADAVLVPVPPSPLSVRMLQQLTRFVSEKNWRHLMLIPFFSMVDRRRSLHRESVSDIRRQFPLMLKTEIPYSRDVEQTSVRRAPLPAYARKSPMARVYADLWHELDSRLGATYRDRRRFGMWPDDGKRRSRSE